jgi:hypothetical protein
MLTRLALIFSVVASGLALSGCTRCGPIWTIRRNHRSHAPKSRTSDRFGVQDATLGVEAGAMVYRWGNAGSVP